MAEAEQEEQKEEIQDERSLEQVALEAYDKLEEKDEQAKSEEKPKEDEKDESAEEEAESEKESEEGYFADEVEEEPDEEVPQQVKDEWKNLSPLQQYLAENIQPLTISGTLNGKPTSLQVYAVENIPSDFEFDSRGSERQALVNLDRMERKAERLEDQFNQQQQQREAENFSEQENRDIRTDIADLQRAGELPLFTPGEDVDSDPKAETARKVLDFYNKENQERFQNSQRSGRLYNRISYKDAYYLWKAQNPEVNEEQKAEDSERKEITRRAAKAGRGATAKEYKKLDLPMDASWDQVINAALR